MEKIITLLEAKEDLLNKEILRDFNLKLITKNSNLIFLHDLFFLKVYLSKELKNKIFWGSNHSSYFFNLIPFQRFRLIYSFNIILKKIFTWIKVKHLVLKGKNVVIFAEFTWYSYLKRFNPKIFLLCPNLKTLLSDKQIETIELVRNIALQAKAVFTRTTKETKEMKIFNKKVVQKNWSR